MIKSARNARTQKLSWSWGSQPTKLRAARPTVGSPCDRGAPRRRRRHGLRGRGQHLGVARGGEREVVVPRVVDPAHVHPPRGRPGGGRRGGIRRHGGGRGHADAAIAPHGRRQSPHCIVGEDTGAFRRDRGTPFFGNRFAKKPIAISLSKFHITWRSLLFIEMSEMPTHLSQREKSDLQVI